MADTRNNPHFVLFPINNDRTGFQPFAIPALYVEPRRLDENGTGIADTESLRVRYYVVDAPDPARVAGPFNQNVRIPDEALFEIELTSIDLTRKQLDLKTLPFFDAATGEQKSFIDAEEGDEFEYRMNGPISGSEPIAKTVYYPDAFYYDVSDVFINTDDLIRPNRYLFVWESVFFRRIASASGELKCLTGEQGVSQLILDVNHPGDVHEAMFRLTPNLYFDFENNSIQDDPTLKFYRPLADALQDIFDEQGLLDGVNQVNSIPAEYIPYLAYLIGVDLPNFPGTTDSLRRSILRRGSELQKLKSSRRVLKELFNMFGFIVDIVNLQSSLDGNSYLAPGNGLDVKTVTQTDLVLNDYDAAGFGVGEVPLVFRPVRNSQVVLNAWIVKDGSSKYNELVELSNNLSEDLEYSNIEGVSVNTDGNLEPQFVSSIGNSSSDIIGYSSIAVGSFEKSYRRPVLNKNNITYNDTTNLINLFFDHELSVDLNAKVFVFATYVRNEIIIPEELSNTRSNKFDVEFLDKQELVVDFNLLQFLLDFVFNLKGFHSLLRKIKVPILNNEVYNVIDTCVDGLDPFSEGTELGEIQSSPYRQLNELTCESNEDRGFKQSDLALRNIILDGLENEFQAWKALSSDDCQYTSAGQDKVIVDDLEDPEFLQTLCENDPSKPDYCYPGRVRDNLENLLTVPNKERYGCNPCGLNNGDVVYWEKNGELYYTDQSLLGPKISDQNTKVINPFEIGIEKDNLGFPSHRFLSMDALESDYNFTDSAIGCFEYDDVRRRPWDNVDGCGVVDTLNAEIIVDNGYEVLVWDEKDLIYTGNGRVSDIPSLSDHGDISDGKIITHKIYQNSDQGHESIEFDQIVFTNDDLIFSDAITGPIFDTACENSDDYIDGYPASINFVDTDKTTFVDGDTGDDDYLFCEEDITCSYGYLDRVAIADALCLEENDITSATARYFGGSQEYINSSNLEYKYYIPNRLDCGCLSSPCATENDECDFNLSCDNLDVGIAVNNTEQITLCDRISNFDLPDLFCLNDDCITPGTGSFVYKDDYNILYEVEWVVLEDTMDITVTTKDPRIPGVEQDGHIELNNGSYDIYRNGIINSVRQILKFDDFGNVFIEAEGHELSHGLFLSNPHTSNPFAYNIDCALGSKAELLITDGPHWMDVDEPTYGYVWSDPLSPLALSSDEDLIWIDPVDPDLESGSSESTGLSSDSTSNSTSVSSISSVSSESYSTTSNDFSDDSSSSNSSESLSTSSSLTSSSDSLSSGSTSSSTISTSPSSQSLQSQSTSSSTSDSTISSQSLQSQSTSSSTSSTTPSSQSLLSESSASSLSESTVSFVSSQSTQSDSSQSIKSESTSGSTSSTSPSSQSIQSESSSNSSSSSTPSSQSLQSESSSESTESSTPSSQSILSESTSSSTGSTQSTLSSVSNSTLSSESPGVDPNLGTSWSVASPSPSGFGGSDVAYDDVSGNWVAASNHSSTVGWYSTNGGSIWSARNSFTGTFGVPGAIIEKNGTCVMTDNNGRLATTTDGGLNWSVTYNSSPGVILGRPAHNNSIFVIPTNNSSGDVLTSSNGSSWTNNSGALASLGISTPTFIAYNGSIFCITTSAQTKTYTSSNGTSWTSNIITSHGLTVTGELVGGGGRFMLGGRDSSSYPAVAYSTNGISWTNVTITTLVTNVSINGIVYIEALNRWIVGLASAFGPSQWVYYSNDGGSTWNNASQSGFSTFENINGMSFSLDEGRILGIGTGKLYESV